ncbi:MAG TPA: DNA replication/repair protein RecF [Micromonosporaceae bacterium]|jgi:recF protein
MYVARLELIDFRSYPQVVVEFEPGPNVLVGPNGVGKTNIVEAMAYLATLASHRVAVDGPLVRAGASTAIIRASIVQGARELNVDVSIEPGKANRARLGGSPTRRARDVIGALRMVLFAPEDLVLVRGEPTERRRYLDDLLVARRPRFAGVRADYDRVLKQRNALLRTAYLARKTGAGSRDLSTLAVWDTHLAEHGAELLGARIELCAELAPYVAKAYEAVSAGLGAATMTYRSTLADGGALTADRAALAQRLSDALLAARKDEIDRGTTLVGPHRDDLVLTLRDLPAKGYASHGESWSFALALRLAGYDLLRAEGIEPVLALDDVFAELDAGRRDRLAELVGGASQLMVTCAVAADVPSALRGVRFDVVEGGVRRAG